MLNVKLLISDYFDSLVSQIDIYTEELVEKCNLSTSSASNARNEHEKAMNSARQKLLDEIQAIRVRNLLNYEARKGEFILSQEEKEEFKRRLFAESFCFLIQWPSKSERFSLSLIKTDFFLSQNEIETLKKMLFHFDQIAATGLKLDNNALLVYLSARAIASLNVRKELVISIAKETLNEGPHLVLIGNFSSISLSSSSGLIDLANLRSFVIIPVTEIKKSTRNGSAPNYFYESWALSGLLSKDCYSRERQLGELSLKKILKDAFGKETTKFNWNVTRPENFNPESFHGLENLVKLTYTGGLVTSLHPQSLSCLQNLEELDLSFNEISSNITQEMFGGLKKLKSLNLAHNRIKKMSRFAFAGLSKLRRIELRYNLLGSNVFRIDQGNHLDQNLETFNLDWFKGLSLEYLGISNCGIDVSDFDVSKLDSSLDIKKINLIGNLIKKEHLDRIQSNVSILI